MSLNNSVKASEKFECFKRLSQQFMIWSQEIEGMDQSIDKEKYVELLLKNDSLIQGCAFEEIPSKYKHQMNVSKRNSKDINNNIV